VLKEYSPPGKNKKNAEHDKAGEERRDHVYTTEMELRGAHATGADDRGENLHTQRSTVGRGT